MKETNKTYRWLQELASYMKETNKTYRWLQQELASSLSAYSIFDSLYSGFCAVYFSRIFLSGIPFILCVGTLRIEIYALKYILVYYIHGYVVHNMQASVARVQHSAKIYES